MSDDTIKATRREFLKGAGAAALTVAGICSIPQMASAEGSSTGAHADPWAMLIDIARCQGCDSCALACKEANQLPLKENPPAKLDADTYTFVDRRQVTVANGEVETRYVKRQCMHCLNASCVSACPAAAMHKTEEGPVYYRANRCLGCRYCMMTCPYYALAYEYNSPNPRVMRCTMCYPRLKEGKLPACVEACPMEALTFGKREDLIAIARERIRKYPHRYIDHIYGEQEMGGTSWLYITGAPFEDIGLRTDLGVTPAPELTSGALSLVPMVIGMWPVLLGGIYKITQRKEKIADAERRQEVANAIAATQGEADAKARAAAEKFQKEKERAVDMAVKKALADADKEKGKEGE